MSGKTIAGIKADQFVINGQPTYPGRTWQGHTIEGLLLNSRMVQATFDDLNPETAANWDYPDGPWSADRNIGSFLGQMPRYRAAGLTGMTVNFQGGSPYGYSQDQPWINSAIRPDGTLRPDFLRRFESIFDLADDLGMIVILGLFYFGQEPRMEGEDAVVRAVDETVDWLLERGDTNVLIEIGNEVDLPYYHHDTIKIGSNPALIERVKSRSVDKIDNGHGRLLVSTSLSGGVLPPDDLVQVADFVLLHGNSVEDPNRIREMVRETRGMASFHGQPVLFNEDDHFAFEENDNNCVAAVGEYAGWGFFDYRMDGEGFSDGYQSVPVNWAPDSSTRKRGFFNLVAAMTGGLPVG